MYIETIKVGETGRVTTVTFGGRTLGISDAAVSGVKLRFTLAGTKHERVMTVLDSTRASYQWTTADFLILTEANSGIPLDFQVVTTSAGTFYWPKPGKDSLVVEMPN